MLDPESTLTFRLVIDGQVVAEETFNYAAPDGLIDASSEHQRRIAVAALAEGKTVRLESLNIDGSFYSVMVLEPDGPHGWTTRWEVRPP